MAALRTSGLMLSHGLYALVLGRVELDELAALCFGGCVITSSNELTIDKDSGHRPSSCHAEHDVLNSWPIRRLVKLHHFVLDAHLIHGLHTFRAVSSKSCFSTSRANQSLAQISCKLVPATSFSCLLRLEAERARGFRKNHGFVAADLLLAHGLEVAAACLHRQLGDRRRSHASAKRHRMPKHLNRKS